MRFVRPWKTSLARTESRSSSDRARSARVKENPSDWWRSYFDDRYLLEYSPIFSAESAHRDVARIIQLLGLPLGSKVLDVPCGQGRHANLLSWAGFRVAGLDYSAHLLREARVAKADVQYIRGDMRAMPSRWTGQFDAVLNLFTSLGFFVDPADDARVIAELARVLRPGGTLIWNGASRDGVMARFLQRDWWRADDNTVVSQERFFDPVSGILTVESYVTDKRGTQTRSHRIRLYTATRLAELCADAGLIVEEAYDGWTDRPLGRKSGEMTLVARKHPL
jgi:SAM-dependent methyltransferase